MKKSAKNCTLHHVVNKPVWADIGATSACSANRRIHTGILQLKNFRVETMPIQSAVVSGKGNRIITRWQPNKNKNERRSPQWEIKPKHMTSSRPPLVLVTHYL